MLSPVKKRVRLLTVGTFVLLLTFVLAACSNSSQSNSTTTARTKVTVAATASQTNKDFEVYAGSNFTIHYPRGWKVTVADSSVTFASASGDYDMTVGFTSNANGATTSKELAASGLTGAKANLQDVQDLTLPSTTTLADQTWTQSAITGTGVGKTSAQKPVVEARILSTNYPTHMKSTKGYTIAAVALKQQFDQAMQSYFTPMLQSFAFTA